MAAVDPVLNGAAEEELVDYEEEEVAEGQVVKGEQVRGGKPHFVIGRQRCVFCVGARSRAAAFSLYRLMYWPGTKRGSMACRSRRAMWASTLRASRISC